MQDDVACEASPAINPSSASAHVRIVYCHRCGWMLRAAWYAQELLSTFGERLENVTLSPRHGGIFEVYANDRRIWSRADEGRFPDAKELKQRVRDVIAPTMSLGHADTKAQGSRPASEGGESCPYP